MVTLIPSGQSVIRLNAALRIAVPTVPRPAIAVLDRLMST
jgi:hypothetical protein